MNEAWGKFCTKPFRYNPLHDLESLWWICVLSLLTFTVCTEEPLDDDVEDQTPSPVPSKRTKTKKSNAKSAKREPDDDDEPIPKQAKKGRGRSKKAAAVDDED